MTTNELSADDRRGLAVRLHRIEGQAKGIARMIDDGRPCAEVLTQIAAMRAATDALAGELLELFALGCLRHPEGFGSQEAAVDAAVRALVHHGR